MGLMRMVVDAVLSGMAGPDRAFVVQLFDRGGRPVTLGEPFDRQRDAQREADRVARGFFSRTPTFVAEVEVLERDSRGRVLRWAQPTVAVPAQRSGLSLFS